MKTFKQAVIVAAVVGLSSSAFAADFCHVRFQNAVIDDYPNAVVNLGISGTHFKLVDGVSSTVVSVPSDSTFKVAYSVGAGSYVKPVGGLITWGNPPTSHTRFTHVSVGPNCEVSMPLQRPLYTPTVGEVIVGPGTQVNSVTFMPL